MSSKIDRTVRIAGLIQRDIARLLRWKAKDPRFQHVTVTRVYVTRDFKQAEIFVSTPVSEGMENLLVTLNKAAAYFRRLLAASLQLRSTPRLIFLADVEVQNERRLSELMAHIDTPAL